MFSGLQELLVIGLIIGCLFLLPRIMQRGRQDTAKSSSAKPRQPLSRLLRFAVVVTVFWLLVSIAAFQPWKTATSRFLYIGILPVAGLWGVIWIAYGHRSRRSKQ